MRRERSDHTLQPTALVNEFFLKLCARQNVVWRNRAHFMAAASRAMRRILVDYARSRKAGKRGGEYKLPLDGCETFGCASGVDVEDIHVVLDELAAEDERMAQVVEMRFFGGLSNAEVAEALGVCERTVKRDWQVARAWLFARLQRNGNNAHGAGKTDL
jgi:RNA polymerase sigma factor (TIGR02999 family)